MPNQRIDASTPLRSAKTAKQPIPPATPAVPVRVPSSQWKPPATPAVPATIPFPQNYGDKVTLPSSGSGGMGSTPTGVAAPYAAAPAANQDEWLAQDAEYNDTTSSLQREYENLMAQLARQRGDYETDTGNAMRSLGWDQGNKMWNQQDKLTGYGNAFQNQQGDFASRGMLDSSLYGSSLNDLNRGFEQQRGDLETALQQFLTQQQESSAQGQATLEQGKTAAQRQALARMAASLGL